MPMLPRYLRWTTTRCWWPTKRSSARSSCATANIFNTECQDENNWLFRAANRIHVRTRKDVIRRLLLFRSGDSYRPDLLAESERLLRAQPYLYDAEVRPIRYEGNRVDIEVRTRDVWTLQVGVGFSRSGGENETSIGIEDSNFLGTGKSILVRHESDVDRRREIYRYKDRNLLGKRFQLEASLEDNSDGGRERLSIRRPFYALDARWSASLDYVDDRREQPIYERGGEVDRFFYNTQVYAASFGLSNGIRDRVTRRWSTGVQYETRRFDPIPGVTVDLPQDQTFAFPWIGYQYLREGFVELRDLDRLHRTEDLNLGHDFRATLGRSTTAFGADEDRTLFSAGYDYGTQLGQSQIMLLATGGSGRVVEGRGENIRAHAQLRYYARDFGRHLFYMMVRGDYADGLDGQDQLQLGGDSGLRGYPLRYLQGDRRFLVTLEQRFYTDWHVARLAHIGAAVFVDLGSAWFAGDEENGFDLRKDVGFGLRISSSRSSSASMIHVDVAFPLDGDDSIDSVQFLVTTKETF